ncbi:MAG: GntR family transcriptional regulator [Acidobacteria bacterium]|nr:GntR family transcriptional regulator [Acidobacteriota bacterium]
MPIDITSAVPLYYQLQQEIEAQIANGVIDSGSRLPSEDELIQTYGVSRTTVRKAIQELQRLDMVEIRRGKGTFVLPRKITQKLTELTGFVEDMIAMGFQPSAKVLEKRVIPASDEVARQLQVEQGSEVVRILRVRIANSTPMSLDETYLPFEIGQKIVEEDLEAYPIFSLLEEKYAIPLSEAEYWLESVSAEPHVASALEIEVKAPILLIERTSYSHDHRPVDYEKLFYRGDKIRFSMRLERRRRSIRLQEIVRPSG